MIVDDKIVVTLVTRDAFADLVTGEVGDPSRGTTAVNGLRVSTHDEVDDPVAKADASGASIWSDEREEPTTHTRSITDPDRHVWRITSLEPVHVIN